MHLGRKSKYQVELKNALLQLGHLATPSQEFNREEAEKQRRMMEGSPPTPRCPSRQTDFWGQKFHQ